MQKVEHWKIFKDVYFIINRLNLILSFVSFDENVVYEDICVYLYDDVPKIERNVFNSLELDDQKYVLNKVIYPLIISERDMLNQCLNNELLDALKEEIRSKYSYLNKD